MITATSPTASEAEEEIRNQRDFLRTVVNTAKSIFLVVTPDGNDRPLQRGPASRLTGLPDDESTRGRPFWELFVVPEQADEVRDAFREACSTRAGVEHEHRWRARRRRATARVVVGDADSSTRPARSGA